MSPSSRRAPGSSTYLSTDTIAALASAVGGAVAIIRISGPETFALLRSLAGDSAAKAEPRRMVRAVLRNGDAPLDDALIARFVAPESFTGEDVAELHIHGGAFVANQVLESLLHLGARQALPGEFSFRAVRNGKMALAQAEAIADLISASNGGAVGLALEKMSGTQNRLIDELARNLKRLCMLGEVGIDFSDQDVDEVSLPNLKKRLAPLFSLLEKLHTSYDRGMRLQDGVRVAFVGLPNAGKSSFFNALLGEDRSIVSEYAGTTRDVVREHLTLKGRVGSVTLRLEDTAGLRASSDHVEKIGIARTKKSAEASDLILFIVDPTSALSAIHAEWLALGSPASKTLGILTKSDIATQAQRLAAEKAGAALGISTWASVSSATGDGLSAAIDMIVKHCEKWTARSAGEVLLTRLDHVQAVASALDHLRRAAGAYETDLFAADIRQALYALGPLIGDTLPDDILGQIFSSFCIGK